MASMLYKHGAFTSEDGEFSLRAFNVQRIRSSRNRAQYDRKTLSTSFCVYRDGQTAIKSRWDAIYNALKNDGVDSGFIHDGGAPSLLWLPNSGSTSGVQVVQPPSAEGQNGADYATGLMGSFSVMAEYPIGLDNVLDYRETVTTTGNNGPLKSVIVTDTGPVLIVETARFSPCRATQSGYITTRGAWGIPNAPIWPDLQINTSQGVSYEAPRRNGSELTEFRVSWSYEFINDGPFNGRPLIR